MVMTDSGHPQFELAPEKFNLKEIEWAAATSVWGDSPSVLAAWHFGSLAEGRARSDSDVDVAVLLRSGEESQDESVDQGIPLARLQNDLQLALAISNLDLIDVIEVLKESGNNDEEQALTFTKDGPIPKSCCSPLQSN